MEPEYFQLVLSVFKGYNFVVKRPGGLRCKIISRVNDSILESNPVHLHTNNSEPEFNSQVAWKLTKKQFQDLRLNRGVVKVECHVLNKEDKIESLIGYCNISVKEAIEIQGYDEVDSKNAITVPLSGTKTPWLLYGPKLLFMLHYEDPKKTIAPSQKRKFVVKGSTKKDNKFKAPLPPPPSVDTTKMFSWTINADKGYFQLGEPQPDDDFYVMNFTLVTVKDVHKVIDSKTSKPPDSWRISFEAFGVTVQSDVFQISAKDGSSFLGDKTTARIRANTKEFTRFLQEQVFEMKLESILDDKHEVVGKGYIDLNQLSNEDVHDIRATLDIIPVKEIPGKKLNECPQLQIIVDCTVSFNFFTRHVKLEEICCPQLNITTSKESLDKLQDINSNYVQNSSKISDDVKEVEAKNTIAAKRSVGGGDEKPREHYTSLVEIQEDNRREHEQMQQQSTENVEISQAEASLHASIQQKNKNTKDDMEGLCKQMEKFGVLTPITPPGKTIISHAVVPSVPNSVQNSVPSTRTVHSESIREGGGGGGGAVIPNLSMLSCEPGEFELTLKFHEFHVKSKTVLGENWKISFHYPQLDVGPEDSCELVAKLHTSKENVNYFVFDENEDEKWIFSVPQFTKELLEAPLEIFYNKEVHVKEQPIAFSTIYLGHLFCLQKNDGSRIMSGQTSISVYKTKNERHLKIGFLNYTFTLTERTAGSSTHFFEDSRSITSLNVSSPEKEKDKTVKEPRKSRPNPKSNESVAVLEWRMEEEKNHNQKMKEKEQAYLQVLAREHKRYKEEGDKLVNQKLDELAQIKKEYEKKLRLLEGKEEALKERENKAQDSAREKEKELNEAVEKYKLEIRHLKEVHKIEVMSLSKQQEQTKIELETYKGKNRILEEKLALKEQKISELLALSNKWPEPEIQRKVDLLEQKNQQLKKELEIALEEKTNYKTQVHKLVKELDKQGEEKQQHLIEENENLKLQLFASRQQELLSKDREQVATVSNEIRWAKTQLARQQQHQQKQPLHTCTFNKQSPDPTSDDNINNNLKLYSAKKDVSHSKPASEVEVLMLQREKLLKSQAYTCHDPIIRKLEDEINRKLQRNK